MLSRVRPMASERGLTLLELVVAILILSIATVGTYRVMGWTGGQLAAERQRLLARVAAVNHAKLMRLSSVTEAPPPPSRSEIGGVSYVLETTYETTAGGLSQVTITARSVNGAGARLVAYLPGRGG